MEKELNKADVIGCFWVVKFENGNKPFWLAEFSGDPGRTHKMENAKKFVKFNSAERARIEAEKKFPYRKLNGHTHSI